MVDIWPEIDSDSDYKIVIYCVRLLIPDLFSIL